MKNERPLIISMHVPKCAGTSLMHSLIHAIEAKSVLGGFDRTLFGTFNDFASIQQPVRERIYLEEMPDLNTHDFVHGHFALSSLRKYSDGRLMTIFREPRCRVISHYLYWRGQTESALKDWGAWSERVKLSHGRFHDFLDKQVLATQIDNLFCRFLLCPHTDISDAAFIPIELHNQLYHEAISKLEYFEFVDLLENPALEHNIRGWLGRDFTMKTENATALRSDWSVSLADELTVRALERIWHLTAIDRRLWVYVARKIKAFSVPEICLDAFFVQYVARQTLMLSIAATRANDG